MALSLGGYQSAPTAKKSAAYGGCPGRTSKVEGPRLPSGSRQLVCPPGTTDDGKGGCCGAGTTAAAAGGSLGFTGTLPTAGGAAAAGPAAAQPAWTPSGVERPGLTPIQPEAAYDPEIARTLASQRANVGDLRAGTGFAMDVLTTGLSDQQEAELQQAKAGAIAQGIPFDEAAFRTRALQSRNRAMGEEKTRREEAVTGALAQEAGTAQGQAGERTQRLETDLRRDVAENELSLDRYGRDITKYGIDAAAATAANNALMEFYSRLAGGAFNALGSAASAGASLSNSYRFG